MQISKYNYFSAIAKNFSFKAGYKDMSDENKKYLDKRINDFIRFIEKLKQKKVESRDVFIKGVPARLDVYENDEYVLHTEDNQIKAAMTLFEYSSSFDEILRPKKRNGGLEIGLLYSKGNGGGRYMIKEAVKKSNELGYDGMVNVFACNLIPSAGCPVPFYYKLGFKPDNSEKEKQVKEAMQNYEKSGVYEGPDSICMHLDEAKIKEFLD